VLGTTLPVFLLVMVGLVSFFVTTEDTVSLRMGAVLSSSVAITTYEQAVRGTLPEVAYLTYADIYFITTYVYHLFAALKIALAMYSPLVDRVTNALLLGGWVLLHITLASLDQIVKFLPRRSGEFFRPSWRWLIQEMAAAPHWDRKNSKKAEPFEDLCDATGNVTDESGAVLVFKPKQ